LYNALDKLKNFGNGWDCINCIKLKITRVVVIAWFPQDAPHMELTKVSAPALS